MPADLYDAAAVVGQSTISVDTRFNAQLANIGAVPGLLTASRDPETLSLGSRILVYNINPASVGEGEATTVGYEVKSVRSGTGTVKRWERDL